jgi:hypothetical protein
VGRVPGWVRPGFGSGKLWRRRGGAGRPITPGWRVGRKRADHGADRLAGPLRASQTADRGRRLSYAPRDSRFGGDPCLVSTFPARGDRIGAPDRVRPFSAVCQARFDERLPVASCGRPVDRVGRRGGRGADPRCGKRVRQGHATGGSRWMRSVVPESVRRAGRAYPQPIDAAIPGTPVLVHAGRPRVHARTLNAGACPSTGSTALLR